MESKNLFTVALKNGNYVSIDKFSPGIGERCGCICPECGEPLRSNVTAKSLDQLKINYTNHFSHINEDSICNGGYLETQIHLAAKRIIESNSSVIVPSGNGEEEIKYTGVKIEPAFPDQELKRYRPDIIIKSIDEEDIAIEIVVTSPVTAIKESLYRDRKLKSLVIDLSRFKESRFEDVEYKLSYEVLKSIENKKWIWNNEEKQQVSNKLKGNSDGFWLIILVGSLFICLSKYFNKLKNRKLKKRKRF